MSTSGRSKLALAACLASLAAVMVSTPARAVIQPVNFNVLTESATLANTLNAGDSLRLDTLVTTEVGPLLQSVSFTVGSGVGSFTGQAAWEVGTATGVGPRLVGVNIDVVDSFNTVVASDSFAGTLAGFAHSLFLSDLSPGSYRLVATGTGVRASSLDVTLSFLPQVPELGTSALMLAGLCGMALFRRRA